MTVFGGACVSNQLPQCLPAVCLRSLGPCLPLGDGDELGSLLQEAVQWRISRSSKNHTQLPLSSCLVLAEDLGMKANLPSSCGVPVARGDSNNTEMNQETNAVFSEVHDYVLSPPRLV